MVESSQVKIKQDETVNKSFLSLSKHLLKRPEDAFTLTAVCSNKKSYNFNESWWCEATWVTEIIGSLNVEQSWTLCKWAAIQCSDFQREWSSHDFNLLILSSLNACLCNSTATWSPSAIKSLSVWTHLFVFLVSWIYGICWIKFVKCLKMAWFPSGKD